MKYNKASVTQGSNGEAHLDFGIQTRMFFDQDPAWNGINNWDLECVDLTIKAKKISSVFSWLIIALSVIPSLLSIGVAKVKPEIGKMMGIVTNATG